MMAVRKWFFEEFWRHRQDFSEVDPEALFNGTVMHNLDHTQGSSKIHCGLGVTSQLLNGWKNSGALLEVVS